MNEVNIMNVQDILALVNAGFTRQEIMAMSQPEADPQPADPQPAPADPQPEAAPQPAPADPQPAADPPAADPPQPAGPGIADLLKELQSLREAVQAGNRNSAQQPEQARVSGEDILAGIIRPPKK